MNTENVNTNETNEETPKVETVVFNKTKRKDIKMIDPRRLIVSGLNTRTDMGDIVGLMNSIIENGIETPFTGYVDGENYVVIAGHRRRKAVLMAIELGHNIAFVPIITRYKPLAEEFLFQTLLSNDGKNMNALELGETYKQLINFGFSVTEIFERVGKTYKHVSDMINVANSSKETKKLIISGIISPTLVAEIKATVKDNEKSEALIKETVEKKNNEALAIKEAIAAATTKATAEAAEATAAAEQAIADAKKAIADAEALAITATKEAKEAVNAEVKAKLKEAKEKEKTAKEKAKAKAKAKAKTNPKIKVTKKDIEVLTKTIAKTSEKTFTLAEVTEMLELQRSMCASVLVDEIDQGLVRNVSLALPKENVIENELA